MDGDNALISVSHSFQPQAQDNVYGWWRGTRLAKKRHVNHHVISGITVYRGDNWGKKIRECGACAAFELPN